jgi:hypothetical protein
MRQAEQDEIDRRLDLTILQRLSTASDPLAEWHRIRMGWRQDPRLEKLSLPRLVAPALIDDGEADDAVRNLADFAIEPFVLSRMNLLQARDYLLGADTTFSLDLTLASALGDGPIILETLHHHCIFSMLYTVLAHLVERRGIDKVILLHLRDPLDSRLEVCRACAKALLGVEGVALRMGEDWRSALVREVTPHSVVFYMGDMPASIFGDRRASRRQAPTLELFARPQFRICIRAVSAARALAHRLGALHLRLDFPAVDEARLRPASASERLVCPLSAWAFWPTIPSLYGGGVCEAPR